MNKKKDKENKLLKYYNNYKELKKDPRKRAGIKLGGYLIFFIVLLILASITSSMSTDYKDNSITTTTTTTKKVDRYREKQNKLLVDKYNINYEIKYNGISYKINGILENNIINGYYENNNEIKKIKLNNNEVFEIVDNIDNKIDIDFDINYISLNYLFSLFNSNSAFIQDVDNEKTYLYEFDENNMKIYVTTNENDIVKISIEVLENLYILNFDK